MKEIGRGLARLFPKAEAIVSSPLRRALETAEWVARGYKHAIPVETSPALAPVTDAARFGELLQSVTARRAIFVGHEPTLSELALALTAMNGALELKKGGCYGIRLAAGGEGHLEWMLPPRAMR